MINKLPNVVEIEVHVERKDKSYLREYLGHGQTLFALLDACDEPMIPSKVSSLGKHGVSLYRGNAEQDYAFISPYLVEVDIETLDWIIEYLGDSNWGYFVWAKGCRLSDLRTHFRRYLTVIGLDGRKLLFRFYDPRVLVTFLRSSLLDEAKKFFGPIQRFGILETKGLTLIELCEEGSD